MTDASSASAGWYPDPSDPRTSRYWDGTAWTAATAGPPVPAPPRRTPGVDTNTVWIWIIVLLPLVITVPALFVPWGDLFDYSGITDDPSSVSRHQLEVLSSPWLWGWNLLGYAIYGLNVFFAYRDRRALLARGIDKPFPWPWAFLNPVYPIGRAIVAIRRTGSGQAVLWGLGAVIVAENVIGGILVWEILNAALGGLSDLLREVRVSSR